ncbi:MAG: ATP-binding protein [Myxococcota bacterium]|nr:ATP-binding protein [Myxococcota bacterium]
MNASQAIPRESGTEGVVRVTLRPGPPGFCLLEISDNGAGVPPELRARIFEPFFTTRPIGAGTGLGLSVCHGIVEALGGRIELADDHLGPGSTFRLFAPQAAVEAQPRIAAV